MRVISRRSMLGLLAAQTLATRGVLAQTHRPIEIILVDDGSTDATPAVLDQLAWEHPGIIRVFHQENQGPGPARERGRKEARGEFIQYLDSDDWLLPHKFTLQVKALKEHPDCGIAYGPARLVDDHAHRTLFVVFADVGHAVKEVGIHEIGHGDEKLIGEVAVFVTHGFIVGSGGGGRNRVFLSSQQGEVWQRCSPMNANQRERNSESTGRGCWGSLGSPPTKAWRKLASRQVVARVELPGAGNHQLVVFLADVLGEARIGRGEAHDAHGADDTDPSEQAA